MELIFSFIMPKEGDDLSDEEEELPENECNYNARLIFDDKTAIEGMQYFNDIIKIDGRYSRPLEFPPPLNRIKELTMHENPDISNYAWTLVRRLCGSSEFACSQFIQNGLLEILCENIINSTSPEMSYYNLKILHHIAGHENKEIFESLFQKIHINSINKNLSPIQVVILCLDKHIREFTSQEYSEIISQSGFSSDDYVSKIRVTLIRFLTAILYCSYELNYTHEVQNICEILILGLAFPYPQLRILVICGIQMAFHYFKHFIFTPYKENAAYEVLTKYLDDKNVSISIETIKCMRDIIKYKNDERLFFATHKIFDNLMEFIQFASSQIDTNPSLSQSYLEARCVAFLFIDDYFNCIKEVGCEQEISIIFDCGIYWMLLDIVPSVSFKEKQVIVHSICSIIKLSSQQLLGLILEKCPDLIQIIVSVFDDKNDKFLTDYLLALEIYADFYKQAGKKDEFISILTECEVTDFLDEICEDAELKIQMLAKSIKSCLLDEEEDQ
ncbi:hypothetical protein TVAG_269300 [Trichomonas vaginalis G3]|uniref:Uncharacterized protein n=1 Tax=Trichomonas vaginalis (strain ATCC PRA-98 / G3) TaxID=412133 RepID=A2EG43_TRIV3|nr:armadillo (ARM) repeat-containing protein family [Trichomonas vaginalis G3]EAY08404.1 hypothetical protein TVAG_269300 [Trichomonas vaginalis G3]KAI5499313.1 armadillo (ARM) repeat-containing protein family [Trichomonas vaginalis G3]|eukprot:XP_001320627.1 hypothetical protein [Trichomonas vaginalis G3]